MCGRHIVALTKIRRQIKQQRWIVCCYCLAFTVGRFHRLQMHFVVAVPHRPDFGTQIIKHGLSWTVSLTLQDVGKIVAVEDAAGRQIDTCQRTKGGQQVHRRSQPRHLSWLHDPRAPDNGRFAHAPFEGPSLPSPQRP